MCVRGCSIYLDTVTVAVFAITPTLVTLPTKVIGPGIVVCMDRKRLSGGLEFEDGERSKERNQVHPYLGISAIVRRLDLRSCSAPPLPLVNCPSLNVRVFTFADPGNAFKFSVNILSSAPIFTLYFCFSDAPSSSELLAATRAHIQSTTSWTQKKSIKGVKIFTASSSINPKGPAWFCRVSEHGPEEATFDEFWQGLGVNHSIHEKEYIRFPSSQRKNLY